MILLLAVATAAFQTPDEMRVDATGRVWELCIVQRAQSPLEILPNLTTKEVVEKATDECAAFKIDMELALIRYAPQLLRSKGVTGFGAGLINSLAHDALLSFESKMLASVTAIVNQERRSR